MAGLCVSSSGRTDRLATPRALQSASIVGRTGKMLTLQSGNCSPELRGCEDSGRAGLDPGSGLRPCLFPVCRCQRRGSQPGLLDWSVLPCLAPCAPALLSMPLAHRALPCPPFPASFPSLCSKPHQLVETRFQPQLCSEVYAGPFPTLVLDDYQAPLYCQGNLEPQVGPITTPFFLGPPVLCHWLAGVLRVGLAQPGLAPASCGASLTQ